MRRKKLLRECILLFIIVVVYTILTKVFDVAAVGPQNSEVGFSTINHYLALKIGYNETFYQISKILGIIPFLLILYYGLIGLRQLIKRKSILAVDQELLILGCFYILVGVVYVFFEKVIINYRPVMFDGLLEASYPSSHTMLALTIGLSSILISKEYISNHKICIITNIITWIVMIALVLTRLLSGVHWFTDIIGGVLISLFLVQLYRSSLEIAKKRKSR